MSESERPRPHAKTPPRRDKKRPRDKPLSLYPVTEDEVLRQLLDAGPLPGKEHTKKKTHHYGGATTTPKSKPTKGVGHAEARKEKHSSK